MKIWVLVCSDGGVINYVCTFSTTGAAQDKAVSFITNFASAKYNIEIAQAINDLDFVTAIDLWNSQSRQDERDIFFDIYETEVDT